MGSRRTVTIPFRKSRDARAQTKTIKRSTIDARDDAPEETFYDAHEKMSLEQPSVEKIKKMPKPKTVAPVVEKGETTTATNELKQLAFVVNATETSLEYVKTHALTKRATAAYEKARDATALRGSLTKIESLIAHYGQPVAKKVCETYPVALVKTANAAYAYAIKAKEQYPDNLDALKQARSEYLSKVEHAIEELKTRAVKLPEEAMTALKMAIAQARAALDSDKLFARVKSLWEQVITNPRVVAVAEKATPVAERVLAQPVVSKAIDVAAPYAVAGGKYAVAIGKRVMPTAITA